MAFITFINNLPRKHFITLVVLFVFVLIISFIPSEVETNKQIKRQLTLPSFSNTTSTTASTTTQATAMAEPPAVISAPVAVTEKPVESIEDEQESVLPDLSGSREIEIEVKAGDTVSAIFQKEGITAALLQKLLEVDKQYLRLGNLLPGQKLKLLISSDNKLLSLKVIIDLANTLTFTLENDEFISHLETKEGVWRKSVFNGEISGSFYLNAKAAGLSGGQIQQIANALEGKIDFNRQLRVGDKFHVLVAKQYIDGEYSLDSEVQGIVFETHRQTYTAFLNEDERYYDKDGLGVSAAYRRYPFNGKYRISSPFNLKRKHPITKRISPHHGTDFATPSGTRVYSIGDGVVTRVGNHPAAGKYIVIKHGRKYTTRYLHLSKIYVRKGQRLKMGELIAKTGNTGRSTGPHLHYEFQINGRAVNAMKVDLPLSKSVSKKEKAAFFKRRDLYLKEMNVELI